MRRLATRSRRNRFVILRTAGSPPVALHPASLRRSYLRFLGCDQPRHGLAPCRQSVLADALMAGLVPAIDRVALPLQMPGTGPAMTIGAGFVPGGSATAGRCVICNDITASDGSARA